MSQFRNRVARLFVQYDVNMHSIMGIMLQSPVEYIRFTFPCRPAGNYNIVIWYAKCLYHVLIFKVKQCSLYIMSKQLFIKTFGCQMNEHDTEKIAGVLSGMGYSLTDSPDKADMVILNTCSVREKAEFKCYSDLGRINELKKSKPDLIIGVGGGVTQQEGTNIVKKAPYVDLVFGTDNITDIPGLLEKRGRASGDRVSTVRRRNKYLNNTADSTVVSF